MQSSLSHCQKNLKIHIIDKLVLVPVLK